MAYCLGMTLCGRLRPLAPGLSARAVLDKFAGIQILDVHFVARLAAVRQIGCEANGNLASGTAAPRPQSLHA
jgi:hypothetical protein